MLLGALNVCIPKITRWLLGSSADICTFRVLCCQGLDCCQF